ncbi:TAP-like family protein [Mycobacterium xenopi 3993]|nr:TAP-like family protein [Mycobacterium xenopi 3993]
MAAARFRRPGAPPPPTPSSARRYERIDVPALVVEGGGDKLLPAGWAAEIAKQIDGASWQVVERAGHCPQIEKADVVNEVLLEFFDQLR